MTETSKLERDKDGGIMSKSSRVELKGLREKFSFIIREGKRWKSGKSAVAGEIFGNPPEKQ